MNLFDALTEEPPTLQGYVLMTFIVIWASCLVYAITPARDANGYLKQERVVEAKHQ